MFPVDRRAASTSFVARIRVDRKASGAKFMNQSLYMSTDLATSAFHRAGLSRFTAMAVLAQWENVNVSDLTGTSQTIR